MYTATRRNGETITTVLAKDDEGARQKLEKQLNREGRSEWYDAWLRGARRMVKKDQAGQMLGVIKDEPKVPEGFTLVERLHWPAGNSPTCPACGNWNALLDDNKITLEERVVLRDAHGLRGYECRDCGALFLSDPSKATDDPAAAKEEAPVRIKLGHTDDYTHRAKDALRAERRKNAQLLHEINGAIRHLRRSIREAVSWAVKHAQRAENYMDDPDSAMAKYHHTCARHKNHELAGLREGLKALEGIMADSATPTIKRSK
jgi:hypothetical protein